MPHKQIHFSVLFAAALGILTSKHFIISCQQQDVCAQILIQRASPKMAYQIQNIAAVSYCSRPLPYTKIEREFFVWCEACPRDGSSCQTHAVHVLVCPTHTSTLSRMQWCVCMRRGQNAHIEMVMVRSIALRHAYTDKFKSPKNCECVGAVAAIASFNVMGPNAKSLAYGWRSTTLVIIAFNIIIYSESGWARVRLYDNTNI